ncbi:MAG: class I SAM-dependent rRNA methyltransferase [Candidatus Izemoplasmatales bacterium]
MTKIILKKNEEDRLLMGHSWVYNNEVFKIEGEIRSGDIVSVFSSKGEFLGKGFLNTYSKIFVRLITRENIEVDEALFFKLLNEANERRLELGFSSHYRAFFGEADFIPGLIVDKYGDYLSIQVLSLGVEERKEMFVRLLTQIFCPLGIYERSDVSVRVKEGLSEFKGVLYGTVPDEITVVEQGLKIQIDIKNGQKTGAFLDQSENHFLVKKYAKGKVVLDSFSHIGQFALHAKMAGASHVEAVDLSSAACERIKANAKLNNLDIDVINANVFDYLRNQFAEGKKYDVVILDPPAFTKNKDKLENAYRGYKEINIQAMKLIEKGGILITASCSQHLTPALFFSMLEESAKDAHKTVQMIDFRIQSPDHPTLLGSEESLYLKLAVLRIF